LVDGAPQVVRCTIAADEHRIKVPLVAGSGATTPEFIRVALAKLPAPLADRLVGHDDAPLGQQLLHVAVAEREPEIEPDGVADDLRREPMAFVAWGGGVFIHAPSIPHPASREADQVILTVP